MAIGHPLPYAYATQSGKRNMQERGSRFAARSNFEANCVLAHWRMARGGHGLQKVSPEPVKGRHALLLYTPKTALRLFQGWSACRAGNLQLYSPPLVTPRPCLGGDTLGLHTITVDEFMSRCCGIRMLENITYSDIIKETNFVNICEWRGVSKGVEDGHP
jgi:hypothetical protein